MKRSFVANESGIALVTAMLVLMVASALMAGMFAALLADQRSHATDRDQSVAYAAAHAGLEKLTSSLAGLFNTDFSPSATQISNLTSTPPTISGFEYTAPGGAAGSGYAISFTADANGNPKARTNADITTGPFEGFKGLITPYTITVTAKSTSGNSEVRLRRELQTVAVPVFQFGIFGEKTLGFHAGPNFDFGGRVHTNQSLYLAAGTGSTLTFRDKITAFVQVVRNTLSNGRAITLTNHTGTVSIPKVINGTPSDYRNLADTESSGTTAVPWSGWKNLSEVTYRTNIRTERTGAKVLNLPLVSAGATPVDLLRRPKVLSAENTANAFLYGQRYYAQASLRILLSDRSTDITNLPTIDNTVAPVNLSNLAASGYAAQVGPPFRTPAATSPGPEGTMDAATGVSLTRVSAIAGTTLTVQTEATTAGPWAVPVAGVGLPAWLRWTSMTAETAAHVAYAGPMSCTGITVSPAPYTLTGCTHVAFANAAIVKLLDAAGAVILTGTLNALSPANANIVFTALSIPTIQNKFVATRTFFVGEDPVVCTGFNTTQLLGCTWPAGATITANDPVYTGATTPANTNLLGGFIKIEKQGMDVAGNANGVWTDVTMELLNLGFSDKNQAGADCTDPTSDAVIRLQRFRDNGLAAGGCTAGNNAYSTSMSGTDYVPNTLFDPREGSTRLLATDAGMNAGGVFGYVALDVNNFRRWISGTIGTSGATALNNNGYIVYFSDRRGDHKQVGDTAWPGEDLTTNPETGEYGFEDSINPSASTWTSTMSGRGTLEVGEDFNENNILDTYGETPHALATAFGPTANMGFDSTSRPWTAIPLKYGGRGRLARPVLFRRALKIINGGFNGAANQIPAAGFAVASENPVYIQGNFNATSADVAAEPNVATAILADSITLLSQGFLDASTFVFPNDANSRTAAADTSYRFAMVTGKAIPFPKPSTWGVEEMGSDGGVHNFMKMIENWAGRNLRYRGSMVSLFYSRQAIGIYRADGNIYGAPTRGYNFDTDFLTPSLLPPGTPMFRDINTLKFRQILRPNQ